MNPYFGFDRCQAFIDAHLRAPHRATPANSQSIKCVTVSRQSGCGAHFFAIQLAEWLQTHLPSKPAQWTVFDAGLVEAVLRDHYLPARLAAYMPEDRVSRVGDIIESLFSVHPPTELLVRQTAETILRLADMGNAIIVGRGANIITAQLPRMLHVRLLGSVKQRVSHMKNFDHLSEKDALARIAQEDGGRARYLKRYFHADINDPLNYHLVINTDFVSLTEAAEMVGGVALHRSGASAAQGARAAA